MSGGVTVAVWLIDAVWVGAKDAVGVAVGAWELDLVGVGAGVIVSLRVAVGGSVTVGVMECESVPVREGNLGVTVRETVSVHFPLVVVVTSCWANPWSG